MSSDNQMFQALFATMKKINICEVFFPLTKRKLKLLEIFEGVHDVTFASAPKSKGLLSVVTFPKCSERCFVNSKIYLT